MVKESTKQLHDKCFYWVKYLKLNNVNYTSNVVEDLTQLIIDLATIYVLLAFDPNQSHILPIFYPWQVNILTHK